MPSRCLMSFLLISSETYRWTCSCFGFPRDAFANGRSGTGSESVGVLSAKKFHPLTIKHVANQPLFDLRGLPEKDQSERGLHFSSCQIHWSQIQVSTFEKLHKFAANDFRQPRRRVLPRAPRQLGGPHGDAPPGELHEVLGHPLPPARRGLAARRAPGR